MLCLLTLLAFLAGTSCAIAATTSTQPTIPSGTQTQSPEQTQTQEPSQTQEQAQPPKQKLTATQLTALPGKTITNATASLRVRFNAPPAPGSPVPTITPAVAGSWSTSGDSQYFKPASTLEPCSTYQLTIWAQSTAVGHSQLGKRRMITLQVSCPSVRGLQQALARLGYLPYRVDAAHGRNSGGKPEARAQAARYAFSPPAARLVPNVPHAPGLDYGTIDTATRGALIVFQENHGLAPSGVPERATWTSLLAAEVLGHRDPQPYTFVTVSERIPETLEVHRGRNIAITSPANTGVAGAETALGTFAIYARYTSTTMSGTNPDGTHYEDPGVPWVNYFNGGDAVHGFPRGSYGTPQSNGCVELPIETAARVYPLLQIGYLVTVSD
ncbi:MAG: L,D-transpeptidase family protein [Solirubrobacteraceae bacterium]